MNWKLKLMKLNWKFKLMIGVGIGLVVVAFLTLPSSQAQTDSESVVQENQGVTDGKITKYANGVSKIEPAGFAITEPLSEMRTDPEIANNTKKKRDEIRIQQMREKGMSEKELEEFELNRQNAKRLNDSALEVQRFEKGLKVQT